MHVTHRCDLSRSLSVLPRNLTDNKHYETTMDRDSSPVFGDSNTIMDRRRKHHQLVLEEIIQFSQWRALDTSERNFAASKGTGRGG